MNREDLVRTIHERHPKFTLKDIAIYVDEIFNMIADGLARGERIELGDFGTFALAADIIKPIAKVTGRKRIKQ